VTCVAWDGKTLAADKYAWVNGSVGLVTKIRKTKAGLVGVSGNVIYLPQIFNWAEHEFDPAKMPKLQEDPKEHASIMLITPDRKIWMYENDSVPWLNERPYWAIGIGREVAIGAMAARIKALGAACAAEAVEIAADISGMCGYGCDTLTFETE